MVKENQHTLHDIKDCFKMLTADAGGPQIDQQIDCGFGRVEMRRCTVLADLSLLDNTAAWSALQSIAHAEVERYHKLMG